MNKASFPNGSTVFTVVGDYKGGIFVAPAIVTSQEKGGDYHLTVKDDDGTFIIRKPWLVYATEEDAHKSFVDRLTLWLERENKRYKENQVKK